MTFISLACQRKWISFFIMKRLTLFTMLFALFMQGLLPAMATTMAQSHMHEMAMRKSNGPHHHTAMLPDGTEDRRGASDWHCPLLPAGCTLGLCIACTALPAGITAPVARPLANAFPDPGPATPLVAAVLAPLVPPPRA